MHFLKRHMSADIHFIHIARLLQPLQMTLLSNGFILVSEQCRVARHTHAFTVLKEQIARCSVAEHHKQKHQQHVEHHNIYMLIF